MTFNVEFLTVQFSSSSAGSKWTRSRSGNGARQHDRNVTAVSRDRDSLRHQLADAGQRMSEVSAAHDALSVLTDRHVEVSDNYTHRRERAATERNAHLQRQLEEQLAESLSRVQPASQPKKRGVTDESEQQLNEMHTLQRQLDSHLFIFIIFIMFTNLTFFIFIIFIMFTNFTFFILIIFTFFILTFLSFLTILSFLSFKHFINLSSLHFLLTI